MNPDRSKNMSLQKDDFELVRATRDGDQEAFGELVRKYQGKIYSLAYGMVGNHADADDLAQEIGGELVEGLMDIILGLRERYREAKNWEQADVLRRQLEELGVVVEDRPEGPAWQVEYRGG